MAEPNASARVGISRLVNNKLRTRLLVTSEPKPDDDDGDFMWDGAYCTLTNLSIDDEFRLTPELHLPSKWLLHITWTIRGSRVMKHDELTSACSSTTAPSR